tara:strand:- start:7257 stop:7418 length:162 start_codon:yes stop_codon:yes gene_type:complete
LTDVVTARIHHNNTYKALRVIGEDYDLYYSVWCTNEHELYNLKVGLSRRLGDN